MILPKSKKRNLSLAALTGLMFGFCSPNFSSNNHMNKALASKIKRKATTNDLKFAINEIERQLLSLGGEDHVSAVKVLYDFADNEYAFAKFEKQGYGIFNFNNSDVVELSPFGSVPFEWYCSDVRYVPWVGFFEKQNGQFINANTKEIVEGIKFDELRKISADYAKQSFEDANDEYNNVKKMPKRTSGNPSTNHELSEGLIYADHEVPHSWFFKRNVSSFPRNGNNTCGYVAASLLLAYAETFECTGYFTEEEAKKYITPYKGVRSYEHGEYVFDGVPDLADGFPEAVWGKDIGDVLPSTIDKAIHSFLKGENKNVKYHNSFYYWEFASITKPIDDGFPAAYFGMQPTPGTGENVSHTTVVYGYYDDGNVLCHFGWPGRSQVVMSKLGMFSQGAVLSIYNESPHRHNKYFIDKFSGKRYCGCGELMSC